MTSEEFIEKTGETPEDVIGEDWTADELNEYVDDQTRKYADEAPELEA